MSPRSDDRDVTPRRTLDDRTADALLSGREVDGEVALTGLITEMRALPAAPVPNAALSAMLENGFTPDVLPPPAWRARRTPRTWALPLQVALGSSACLALVLGAAAAGELPDPAQSAVADVVEAVTPLHVPRPVHHPVPAVVPSPFRSTTPTPGSSDTHRGQTRPPATTPDDHPGRGGGQGNGRGEGARSGATTQPSRGGHAASRSRGSARPDDANDTAKDSDNSTSGGSGDHGSPKGNHRP
jgi:hypothetical protein